VIDLHEGILAEFAERQGQAAQHPTAEGLFIVHMGGHAKKAWWSNGRPERHKRRWAEMSAEKREAHRVADRLRKQKKAAARKAAIPSASVFCPPRSSSPAPSVCDGAGEASEARAGSRATGS
jgi:hypothetical protein